MNLKDFVKQAVMRPGASPALKLSADGEFAIILIDPLHAPKDAKFGQLSLSVVEQTTDEADKAVWVPRTLYLTPSDASNLVKLLPEDDCRVVLTMVLHLTAKQDRDGEPVYGRDGNPLFNRRLTFDLYADQSKFELLNVPARVTVAQADGPKVEPPRASRPLPKPLV